MRKQLYLFGIILFHFTTVFGQTKQIFGKIIDAKDHSPLPGVTVSARGSRGNAVTGADGSFSIKVGAKATGLRFTYIGYEEQEVAIGASTDPLIISLAASQKSLSEVVVVGYGKALKKEVTGSISQVSSKDIENFPMPSFES